MGQRQRDSGRISGAATARFWLIKGLSPIPLFSFLSPQITSNISLVTLIRAPAAYGNVNNDPVVKPTMRIERVEWLAWK